MTEASGDITIAVFGSSKPVEGTAPWQQAFELGAALAGAGFTIINGGYGGIMAASAHGAASMGGQCIGVTCAAFGRGKPNAWITQEIHTTTLNERLETLIDRAHGVIALPGGTGTLLEIAMIWELINKKFLAPRPLLTLGSFWDAAIGSVESFEPMRAHWQSCGTIAEVLDTLKKVLA